MFDTVLIANRGEIARRVIRTLDRLGIVSVAVHAPDERDAPHVREATRAMEIPGYLDLAAILAAARETGAQALHPGYGFLSENPDLAAGCARDGIAFVGPPAAAVALMGDKVAAKALARECGLPVLDTLTAAQAAELDVDAYPLLVKAAAGGGGRGMRVVAEPAGLAAALAAAAREAEAGFGDARVFVERYLPRARHLEVQVIADVHGHAVHLGERECSLQRRHQKVLEESPSPAVDASLRARLGEQALALVRASGYVNAGTVEFIADAAEPGRHWFLEMNARLQVEHPVTEAVCGVDLVALQLRVAAGEPLGLTQDDVVLRGHAVEARVTAEDPDRGFLPTAGPVLAFSPAPAALARTDAAIETGGRVGTGYDSLLAKVVVHDADRPAALRRLDRALAGTTILGLTTSGGYLRRLLAEPAVAAGELDTGLLERIGPRPGPLADADVARAAALLEQAELVAQAGDEPFARHDGWRLAGVRAGTRRTLVVAGGEPVDVALSAAAAAEAVRRSPGHFTIAGRGEWRRAVAGDGATAWIGHGGDAWPVAPAGAGKGAVAAGDGAVRAPMPGQVLALLVALGDAVAEGDPLLVLESMKMELTLAAPHAGRVDELAVAVGDAVVVEQVLARVETGAGET